MSRYVRDLYVDALGLVHGVALDSGRLHTWCNRVSMGNADEARSERKAKHNPMIDCLQCVAIEDRNI